MKSSMLEKKFLEELLFRTFHKKTFILNTLINFSFIKLLNHIIYFHSLQQNI